MEMIDMKHEMRVWDKRRKRMAKFYIGAGAMLLGVAIGLLSVAI